MGYAYFNIDSSDVKNLAEKLNEINKWALPLSIRMALNDVARDMKSRTLPLFFNENFNISPTRETFLKSHSAYTLSKNTLNITEMSSYAGVWRGKSSSALSSGERLKIHETGGSLGSRDIPYSRGHFGISYRNTNPENAQHSAYFYRYFKNKKKGIILKNRGKRIIKTENAIMISTRMGISNFRVLYLLNKNPKYHKNSFINPSGNESNKLVGNFFIKHAKKRIEKLMQKK